MHVSLGAALVRFVYPLAPRRLRLALRALWCRIVLRILGVELSAVGAIPAGCHLIAANHISWLDTFVIGALFPCWYVSKSETRAWPLLGWMAAVNDTLFLRRGSARAVWRINAQIRQRFASGQSVVVFPEGTTTDGSRVLAFYPALFQPAVDAGCPVLPIALSYYDAEAALATAVAYINDEPLWTSLCAVLDAPVTRARLLIDATVETTGRQRRELARGACEAVRRMQARCTSAAPSDALAASAQPATMAVGVPTN